MKQLFTLILALAGLSPAIAQRLSPQVISPGGDLGQAGSINVSYTLGQTAPRTNELPNGALLVTQGFQQPLKFTPIGRDGAQKKAKAEKLYPNPSVGRTTFEAEYPVPGKLHLTVHDVHGRVVMSVSKFLDTGYIRQELNLSEMAIGMYSVRATYRPRSGAPHSSSFKLNLVR